MNSLENKIDKGNRLSLSFQGKRKDFSSINSIITFTRVDFGILFCKKWLIIKQKRSKNNWKRKPSFKKRKRLVNKCDNTSNLSQILQREWRQSNESTLTGKERENMLLQIELLTVTGTQQFLLLILSLSPKQIPEIKEKNIITCSSNI